MAKDFTFHDAMKDSPSFRFELGQHERHFDRLGKRLEEMVRSIDIAIEKGQHFVTAFYNLTVSLNHLWSEMHIDEWKEKTAVDTFKKMYESLSHIHFLNKSLVEHAYPALKNGFESFMRKELSKLNETKAHFDNLSTNLSESFNKKAAINRNREQELHDAENNLTAIGTCFSHTSLDYVAQINIANAIKCPIILETIWAFVKEHGNFFTRGAHFFAEQQDFLIGEALSKMRMEYKLIERRMQDRHTIVPKEIYQYPSGIPTDPLCIMEGYLFKRATNAFKTWNRRWFMIKEGKLLYAHKSNDGERDRPTIMEADLKLCLVRPALSVERACCFELVTPTRNHLLQADSQSLCNAWIKALQRTIQHLHEDDNSAFTQPRKSFIENFESSSSLLETTSTSSSNDGIASSTSRINIQQEMRTANQSINRRPNVKTKQDMKLFLKELLAIDGNDRCADCGNADAKWTSLNLGVIICIECSGVHRSLGVQISKVRSLTMDSLEEEQRNILIQLGNNRVNRFLLRHLSESMKPINKDSSRDKREKWITLKYVDRAFARQSASSKVHSRCLSLVDIGKVEHQEIGIDNLGNAHLGSRSLVLPNGDANEDCIRPFKSALNLIESANFEAPPNLYNSLKDGNLVEVLNFMTNGLNLNSRIILHNSSKTPLHIAVEHNRGTLVEFLLLNGAKINEKDSKSNTSLHLAAEMGHIIIVYQLLKRSADKDAKNGDGKTALELAVEKCHADIVTLLRLHNMKQEFNDDQNSTVDETMENFIGDLAAKHAEERTNSTPKTEAENG